MSVAGNNMSRPRPVMTPFSAFFWEGAKKGQLLLQFCGVCHRFQHPPGPTCIHCGSDAISNRQVSGEGKLDSFTVVRHLFHPAFADDLPYIVARVQLEEQADVFLITNLRDCAVDAAYVGMPVSVMFETVGEDVLPQFRPSVLRKVAQ